MPMRGLTRLAGRSASTFAVAPLVLPCGATCLHYAQCLLATVTVKPHVTGTVSMP